MAYFLKISHYRKGEYLQIYNSFRDPQTRKPKNKCYRTLGYVQDLKDEGITDPVAYFKEEIRLLNLQAKREKAGLQTRTIAGRPPVYHPGIFALKALWRSAGLDDLLDGLAADFQLQFSFSSCLQDMVMALAADLVLEKKSFQEGTAALWKHVCWNTEQITEVLRLCGKHREKILRAITEQMEQCGYLEKNGTYFAFANFYFDLPQTLEFLQQKEQGNLPEQADLFWQSVQHLKQNDDFSMRQIDGIQHKNLVLSAGLLLDSSLTPVSIDLYPGNRHAGMTFSQAAKLAKEKTGTGHLVRVSDRMLNEAMHQQEALRHKDGWLFRIDPGHLNQTDLGWLFEKEGWGWMESSRYPGIGMKSKTKKEGAGSSWETLTAVFDPKQAQQQREAILALADQARNDLQEGMLPSPFSLEAKYIRQFPDPDAEAGFLHAVDEEQIDRDLKMAGIMVLASSNTDLDGTEMAEAYQDLWSFREAFFSYKRYIDQALPWAKTAERIEGMFVIGFLAVLLKRIFQRCLLDNRFTFEQIGALLHGFQVTEKLPGRFINLSKSEEIFEVLQRKWGIPLLAYELGEEEIEELLQMSLSRLLPAGRSESDSSEKDQTEL